MTTATQEQKPPLTVRINGRDMEVIDSYTIAFAEAPDVKFVASVFQDRRDGRWLVRTHYKTGGGGLYSFGGMDRDKAEEDALNFLEPIVLRIAEARQPGYLWQ